MDVTSTIARQNNAYELAKHTASPKLLFGSVYWLQWSICQRISRCISRTPISGRKINIKGVTYEDFSSIFQHFDALPLSRQNPSEQLHISRADGAERMRSDAIAESSGPSTLVPRKGSLAKRRRTRKCTVASRPRVLLQRKTRGGAIKEELRGCWHGPQLCNFLELHRFKRRNAKCYKSGAVFGSGTISFISRMEARFKYAGSVPTLSLQFDTCIFHNTDTPIRTPVDCSASYTATRIGHMYNAVKLFHAEALADGVAIPFESELPNTSDAAGLTTRLENGRRVYTTANGSTFYLESDSDDSDSEPACGTAASSVPTSSANTSTEFEFDLGVFDGEQLANMPATADADAGAWVHAGPEAADVHASSEAEAGRWEYATSAVCDRKWQEAARIHAAASQQQRQQRREEQQRRRVQVGMELRLQHQHEKQQRE